MFVMNDDLSIYATRGDIVFFSVSAMDGDRTYKFQPGDIVRISVYGKKEAEEVFLQKDFGVTEVSESVVIYLEEADTKFGESISKHKDYWYEVVLNPDTAPQTIIGYDEDGAKVFRLFPESAEFDDGYEPEQEDFPVVDTELDMTSPRPVANSAIARAVTTILDTCERTNAAVATLHVTPAMYGAIGDGVADDSEVLQEMVDTIPENSIIVLPAEKTMRIDRAVHVTRNVSFEFYGNIVLTGSGSIVFGSEEKNIEFNKFSFNMISGDGKNGETIGLDLRNARYNTFNVKKIADTKYGICINPKGSKRVSIGQNIFYFTLISNCEKGIYFVGNGNWADAVWAEGNQFMGGFINKSGTGLEFSPNIRCGCTIYMGAIDNVEVGGYDIVDNSTEEPNYATTNLIISNFFRLPESILKKRNTYIEPSYGIRSAGDIISGGAVQSVLASGEYAKMHNGTLELYSANPYIDLKNDANEDRDSRIISKADGLYMGTTGKADNALGLVGNKYMSMPGGNTGVSVAAGVKEITVTFKEAMPDRYYNVFISPNWATAYGVITKREGYFIVQFTNAPSEDSHFDYFVVDISYSAN